MAEEDKMAKGEKRWYDLFLGGFLSLNILNTKKAKYSFNKSVAFTLAEVLITLGIIGVVAAMTIPTLMANQQKTIFINRAKQSYAQLLNAVKLSEADNGDLASWDFHLAGNSTENTSTFFKTYLLPYFKGISLCSTGLNRKCGVPVSASGENYILNNGVMMSIVVHAHDGQAYVIFDVNGEKEPNLLGTDAFFFSTANPSGTFKPYGWTPSVTLEEIRDGKVKDAQSQVVYCLPRKQQSDSDRKRHACTLWLYLNNWKIDKDYPW